MVRTRALRIVVAWPLLASTGCDEPQRLEGGLVLGTIEAQRLCDVNAVEVRLVAHWLACPAVEPECEAPDPAQVEGDRFSCPAAAATHPLGVELTHPGVHRFEAVVVPTSGPPEAECFVDPQGGSIEVQLPSERLFAASPVVLDEHGPCP